MHISLKKIAGDWTNLCLSHIGRSDQFSSLPVELVGDNAMLPIKAESDARCASVPCEPQCDAVFNLTLPKEQRKPLALVSFNEEMCSPDETADTAASTLRPPLLAAASCFCQSLTLIGAVILLTVRKDSTAGFLRLTCNVRTRHLDNPAIF